MNFPDVSPQHHPDDLALLVPFEEMSSDEDDDAPPKTSTVKTPAVPANPAFLRRPDKPTGAASSTPAKAKRTVPAKEVAKKPAIDASLETPEAIRKAVADSFDLADSTPTTKGKEKATDDPGMIWTAKQAQAWLNPQHPSRKNVRPVDVLSIKPDLEGYPDTGAYMVMKFSTDPTNSTKQHDDRLDASILRPLPLRPELESSHRAALAAAAADPSKPTPGMPPFDYELHIPRTVQTAHNIQRKLDPYDTAARDDPTLFTYQTHETEKPAFRFDRERDYETANTIGVAGRRNDEVALVLHGVGPTNTPSSQDSNTNTADSRPKAAYYYPVAARSNIRPRRTAVVHASMLGKKAAAGAAAEEDKVDVLEVLVREPTAEGSARRLEHRAKVDPTVAVPLLLEAPEEKKDDDEDGAADGNEDEGATDKGMEVVPTVEPHTPVPMQED